MSLAPHTKANRKFFEKGCYPTPAQWRDWVRDGLIHGKLIGDKIYIDLNWFAANDVMQPQQKRITGLDLLA